MNQPTQAAAFYARVSTDKQDNSLETQLTRARQYAALKNLTIPDTHIFQDSDVSGSKPLANRPGGRLLLNRIAYHASIGDPIQHLIITKIDRLSRSTIDFCETLQALRAADIHIHITDAGGDSMTTTGFMGEMMLKILAVIAEFEREMIRKRTLEGLDTLRSKNILTTGNAPFGWNAIQIPGATSRSGRPQYNLIPCQAELNTILLMHQLRSSGKSYHAIAADLNARGIPTKTGKQWQSGNVAGVLDTRATKEFLAQQGGDNQLAA